MLPQANSIPRRARRFAIALAWLAILVAGSASGQPRLTGLQVAIWPEYDRPDVLVMLRAALPPDTQFPVMVELPMPTAAGAPHAVAKQGPDGSLLVAQHDLDPRGDWTMVQLLTDVPLIRLEYYAPLAPGPQRRYVFSWPGGVEIDNLSYEVLHPVGATNLSLTPSADSAVQGDGLTFYRAARGSLAANESFTIELAYAKSSSELSSPAALPEAPAVEPPAATESPRPLGAIAIGAWVLAGLIVVGSLIMVLRMRRQQPPPAGD